MCAYSRVYKNSFTLFNKSSEVIKIYEADKFWIAEHTHFKYDLNPGNKLGDMAIKLVTLGADISPLMGPKEKLESPSNKNNFFRETYFYSVTCTTASYFSFHLMAIVCVMANLLLN